jgi:Uma2 family endonuclease
MELPRGRNSQTMPWLWSRCCQTPPKPSTAAKKLIAYKRLPGLRAYLLVSQTEPSVEVHARDAMGAWSPTRYVKGETIVDDALGGPLALAELYAGTDLA